MDQLSKSKKTININYQTQLSTIKNQLSKINCQKVKIKNQNQLSRTNAMNYPPLGIWVWPAGAGDGGAPVGPQAPGGLCRQGQGDPGGDSLTGGWLRLGFQCLVARLSFIC